MEWRVRQILLFLNQVVLVGRRGRGEERKVTVVS